MKRDWKVWLGVKNARAKILARQVDNAVKGLRVQPAHLWLARLDKPDWPCMGADVDQVEFVPHEPQ